MTFSPALKTLCCVLVAGSLVSTTTFATTKQNSLISTGTLVEELSRDEAQAQVRVYLEREDVKRALVEKGVAPEEASRRLAALSESELRQLVGQIDQAKSGGDILVTVLIIVLIIFLIKKM